MLNGIPASEGEFTGYVKIYSKDKKFSSSDLLVAESTTPEMSLEILKAGAVATHHGGLLSHAAIFCREINKPCVVGIKDLLLRVQEGVKVHLDGKLGTLEILN